MLNRIAVFFVLVLAGCASEAPPLPETYETAASRFTAQPRTQATDDYGAAWARFNNAHRLDERDGCYLKSEGSLVQILKIDASGTVVGYFPDKDNGRSRCWAQTYLGVTFPKPPFAPFYHRLEMQ